MDELVELILKAVSDIPMDVEKALIKAYETEDSELGKTQLKAILENIRLARKQRAPVCQDTGILHFYLDFGVKSGISILQLEKTIIEATKKATEVVPLRPNAVHPLTRANSGDNTGVLVPIIDWNFNESDEVKITVVPKGAGSENVSKATVLPPALGVKGIAKFVLDCVAEAMGKPCPPTIIGVGIGGSLELAAKLAKKAHLRPVGSRHPDPQVAELEEKLLKAINMLGIGPMGLGGKWTSLDVKIEIAHTHTASLPVAVSFQCWALRRASITI
ncbi:MAG: fumarate hydratase [Candidatus Nezhaarchaeales archaeon]